MLDMQEVIERIIYNLTRVGIVAFYLYFLYFLIKEQSEYHDVYKARIYGKWKLLWGTFYLLVRTIFISFTSILVMGLLYYDEMIFAKKDQTNMIGFNKYGVEIFGTLVIMSWFAIQFGLNAAKRHNSNSDKDDN